MISNRRFGIEFEVGNECSQSFIYNALKFCTPVNIEVTPMWQQSSGNDFWHIKYDSTCGAAYLGQSSTPGWEIATFIATGFGDLTHIAGVAQELKQHGIKTNNNCGLHIHADVADFTVEKMGVLLAYWLKIEPMLCQAVPERRIDNKYCKLMSKSRKIALNKEHTSAEVWKAFKPTNFNLHENKQKKVTLNTVNFAESLITKNKNKCTVEFRLPEGSLAHDDVLYWTSFFVNFIEKSKKSEMPKDLKSVGLIEFFRISDIDLDTKLWFLNRLNKFGNDQIKDEISSLL